ncbi:MAG: HD domain-containing protein [Clostridia bacterium]|nr:HD domain-containing protein [Clostridia bacterium]
MEPEGTRDKIRKILLFNTLQENQERMFKYIPELKSMVGFEHRHPHHNLDVWKHTLAVLRNLNDESDIELKMAGLLHDIGKPFSYQDDEIRHFHGHPEVSKEISMKILTRLGYSEDFIGNVCYLVLKHDTPIETEHLDNSYEMVKKLLTLQYADAKAHHPDKIKKRIDFLDSISKQLKFIKEREER